MLILQINNSLLYLNNIFWYNKCMTKSHIFLFLLLSFVLGVFVRSFFLISSGYCFLLLVFSLIMLFLFYRNKFVVSVSFFISIFIFGIWITDREIAKTENLPHLGKNLQKDAIVEKATPSSSSIAAICLWWFASS